MSLRKFTRLLGALALAYPAATCTDVTGPRGGHGVQVPVVPTFSRTATFAKALYSLAGLEYDRVHVLITRGGTEILKDTTVDFSPASPELTLPLTIAADPGETVTATLEYRNAEMVLYSGSVAVTTIPVGAPNPTPTQLIILPVGPGATAATVQVSPNSGNYPTTDPVAFTAQARTSDGTLIPDALFAWTADDETIATVGNDGVVHPTSKGGTVHVRATTLNEVFGEVAVTFVTGPASLAIQSGGSQTAMAFEALSAPVVVKVRDANGLPVPGAAVSFAVATGGGSLSSINGTSDANGLVSASWTLGDVVGTQSITATATALPNAPLTINATATERPATALAFGQQPTNSVMGAQIMPAVTVRALDDHGRVVAGFTGSITVAFDANPNGATLGGTLSRAAVAGVATFSDLTVSAAGTGYTLKAGSAGLTTVVSSAFDVEQVPSGLSLFAGGSQTATVRSPLSPIAVKVADANGTGAPGVTVDFAVATGGGSVDVASAVTDASGLAHVTWTLGNTVGTQSITATSAGLSGSPLTITAEATPLPAVRLEFAQGPTNVQVNALMTPAVTVRAVDADGNTVTSFAGTITLDFETNPNGATLAGTTTVAAVSGVATFSNLSVNVAGAGYSLHAGSGALTQATSGIFSVTPPPATALEFLSQPSSVQVGTTMSPVTVRIVDVNDATVDVSSSVTVALDGTPVGVTLGGTTTVNAVHGVATFSDLTLTGITVGVKLRATSTGLTDAVSNGFNVVSFSRVWTGSISSDWDEALNWSPSGVPAATDSVTIPNTTNSPVIGLKTSTASVVVIETGASLQVNTFDLGPIAARFVNKGTLRLTEALVAGAIDNRGTLLVDSHGSADSIYNAASPAITQVVGTVEDAALTARVFVNDGTLELNSTATGAGTALTTSDSLVNRASGTINAVQGAGGQRVIAAVVKNYGAINVSNSDGLFLEHPATGSLNAGTITFTAGGMFSQFFIDPSQTFENTGTITLGSASWTIINGKLRIRAGNATGSGTFQTSQTVLDIDPGRLNMPWMIDGLSLFTGTTVTIPAGVTTTVTSSVFTQKVVVLGSLLLQNGGASLVDFQAGLQVAGGGLVVGQVNVSAEDDVVVDKDGKLQLIATETDDERRLDASKSVMNGGTIEMSSNKGSPASIRVGGVLLNDVTGLINALPDTSERKIIGTLDNRGSIFVARDTYLRLYSDSPDNSNTGAIGLEDDHVDRSLQNTDTLAFSFVRNESGGTFTNNGTISIGSRRSLSLGVGSHFINDKLGVISGNGTVHIDPEAVLDNNGTTAPGANPGDPGTLTIDGNWNGGTGVVEIDLVDPVNGAYDVLQVTGIPTLNGTIRVLDGKDYAPKVDDTWPVIQSPNVFLTDKALAFDPVEWDSSMEGSYFAIHFTGGAARKTTVLGAKRPPGTSR